MADMEIYVYPNTTSDDDAAADAKSGLDTAISEIVSNTGIGSYNIDIRYDYPDQPNGDVKTLYDNFSDWRYTYYYQETGAHLCVDGSIDGGLADGGNSSNPESPSWADPKDAVAGTVNAGTAEFQNICTHEVLHTFIDKDLSGVEKYLGKDDTEHELGQETSNGVTPMATRYRDSYAGQGSCDKTSSIAGYKKIVTNCTEESTYNTYKEYIGTTV